MARVWGMPRTPPSLVRCLLVAGLSVGAAQAAVDPADRTADLPDSWLVLYNLNSPDSVAWAQWYANQWTIPASHLVGLDASLAEHLPDLATAQSQIVTPVRNYLSANPEVQDAVMGIVLGYDLPGHYHVPPLNPSIGGFSVSDALVDMADDHLSPASQRGQNADNPHFVGQVLPPGGRITKATMLPDRYMSARIDGPSLDDAKALTLRAKALADPGTSLYGDFIWYDYYDPEFPGTSSREWYWLRQAVQSPALAGEAWAEFDLDGLRTGPTTPSAAFRFAIYKLWSWTTADFDASPAGHRVLAFHYNSYGAVTVRSLTGSNGCYVPNALAAGYAAAIGATGEPQCCVAPFPDTLLASLREGWTLGEAFYLANPFNDWMWNVVGDPFLTAPNWFDEMEVPNPHGDINGDLAITEQDLAAFLACLGGVNTHVDPVCAPMDFDDDEDVDLWDLAGFQAVYEGGPAPEVTFDHDQDGDVDLGDFQAMLDCLRGPGPTAEVFGHGCHNFDADFDLDVDLRDAAALMRWAEGRDTTAAPSR